MLDSCFTLSLTNQNDPIWRWNCSRDLKRASVQIRLRFRLDRCTFDRLETFFCYFLFVVIFLDRKRQYKWFLSHFTSFAVWCWCYSIRLWQKIRKRFHSSSIQWWWWWLRRRRNSSKVRKWSSDVLILYTAKIFDQIIILIHLLHSLTLDHR